MLMINKKKKIGITDRFMSISAVAVLLSVLIYPFLMSSLVLKLTQLISILSSLIFIFSRSENLRKNERVFLWLITLFPVVVNSYALKQGQIGFLTLWLTLLLLVIGGSYTDQWIKPAMKTIGILMCIYAFSTILFNLNMGGFLVGIAGLFRSNIATGTLKNAGFTSHYSHNGMYIALGALVWFAFALDSKKKKLWLMVLLFVAALLFTQKRGPLIAVAAAIVITYFVANSGALSKRLNKIIVLSIVIVAAMYIANMVFPSLFAVFERFSDSDNILTNRDYLWKYAIDMFKEKPFFGHGWGYYPNNLSLRIGTVSVSEMNAHNIYLQLLAETGIVGTLCFLIPMISNLFLSFKTIKTMKSCDSETKLSVQPMYFSLCMQIFFLVYGASGNPLYDKQMCVPYIIAVAITTYYYNATKSINVRGNSWEKSNG